MTRLLSNVQRTTNVRRRPRTGVTSDDKDVTTWPEGREPVEDSGVEAGYVPLGLAVWAF